MSSVLIQKYYYGLHSDPSDDFEKAVITVETKHFAVGTMRLACKPLDHKTGQTVEVIRNIQGNDFDAAKMNVRTQERCAHLAEIFNKQAQVIKKVLCTRLIAVQFLSGQWQGQYSTIEKYLKGQFVKLNCNVHLYGEDFSSLTDRSTPQAFSHFTLQYTNHKELVCDFQRVDDEYTDPQVHTMELEPKYGPGNWGWKGIWTFLAYHHCNDICKALNLTIRQMKTAPELAGTQVRGQYKSERTMETAETNPLKERTTTSAKDSTTKSERYDTW